MATKPTAALRLGMEGKEAIVSGLNEIGSAGDAAGKRAGAAFVRASEDAEAAAARLAQAQQKLERFSPDVQMGTELQGPGTSAGKSIYLAYSRDMAEQQRQADALRNAINPLRVAQKQYDDELAAFSKLLATGRISEAEHAAGVDLSARALTAATKRVEENAGAMGLNRTQTMIAQSAVMRFTDSIIAGQSPIRALALEAHKLGEVAAFDNGGVAGALTKVRGAINPLTVGLTAGTAIVVIATAAALNYADALTKLDAISRGSGAVIGATGAALEQQAEAAARAGDISVATAREIESGYVNLGGIGSGVLSGLTAMTMDFAVATGKDAKEAQQELGKAFQDPVKGAADLAERYGALTQAQIDHIQKLVEQGDLYAAQKQLLLDLEPRFDGAAEHALGFSRAFHDIAISVSDAWNWLGKFIVKAEAAGSAVADLQRQRALVAAMSSADPAGSQALIAQLDAKIAQAKQAAAAASAAPGNAARQGAQTATDQYTGDNRDTIRNSLGTINRGLAAGGTVDQLKEWTAARDANQRAIDTWIPKQQKANELAEADAKIAAARTPAQKQAAAADKEMINLKGEVITKSDAETRAHEAGAKALSTASKSGEKHAETLARDAASMDANITATLALADAYLKGGAAAIEAEARRKALTDATKKGIDVEAEIRRQLALSVAEAVASGAKATRSLRDELTARKAANDNIVAGKLAVGDLSHALSDEAALRPLLTLRTIAHGDALTKLNEIIDTYRASLAAAHEEERRSASLTAIDASQNVVAGLRDQMEFAGDRTDAGSVEIARRAVMRDTDKYGSNTAGVADAKATETQTRLQADRARSLADTLNSQKDAAAYSLGELATIRMGNDERQIALDKLKATISLEAQNVDLSSENAKKILDGVEYQDRLTQAIARTSDAMQELRDFGASFIDDLAKGKSLASDVYEEFLKLALLNPLKNLLGGTHQTTLMDALGSVTKLFGSGGFSLGATNVAPIAGFSVAAPSFAGIPGHANGIDYAPGGLAWVGENGPELMNLPRGSSITPAGQSRQIMQAANNNGGGETHIHVYAQDAVLADTVRGWVRAGVEEAAVRGAYGGATMAENRAAKRIRYRIPVR